MEIRHLKAFCVVAQEMHVTRAAKRLRMKQPALTQQIRLLEKDIGLSLLKRTGRGIALTEAGQFFHKEAETILRGLDDACLRAQEIARGEAGHIRIGVTEGASFNPKLAAVFTEFRARWPDVGLTFSQKQTPDLAQDLREGRLDTTFMCAIRTSPELNTERLFHEAMLLAIPRMHPLAKCQTIPLDALEDEPFILISHGNTEHSLQISLTEACRELGFAPRILQTSPEFMLALNLVASGIALTFVPAYMTNIHAEAIVYRKIEPFVDITMETVIASPTGSTSAAVANLRTVASAVFSGKKRKGKRPSPERPTTSVRTQSRLPVFIDMPKRMEMQ